MATNKNAQLRYKILDECFANIDERYYIEDLIYTCEEKLSQKGKKESISKRTILDDIKFMKSREGYNAPIESIKDEKDKRKIYEAIIYRMFYCVIGCLFVQCAASSAGGSL